MNQPALEQLCGITEEVKQYVEKHPEDPQVLAVSTAFMKALRDYSAENVEAVIREVGKLQVFVR